MSAGGAEAAAAPELAYDTPQTRHQLRSEALSTELEYVGPPIGQWEAHEIIPISDTQAVAGVDRSLVVREIQRLQRSVGQSKRKKLALGCAVTTLAILGATAWQLVEAVRALIATDNTSEVERIVFAIVQVTAWGLCLAGTAVVLSCLRLRRPTRLVLFASCSAIAVIVLQVALIVLNFVLIAVWQNHISNSCASWRFDVIWMERRTCVGAGTAPAGYFIAAAIRLIVVLLLSALWLVLLRSWSRSLARRSMDTETQASVGSSEIDDILNRHAARIIDLPPGTVQLFDHGEGDQSALPHMPEHKRLLAHQDAEKDNGYPGPEADASHSWLWRAIGWMFGVGANDVRRSTSRGGYRGDRASRAHQQADEETDLPMAERTVSRPDSMAWSFGALPSDDSHDLPRSFGTVSGYQHNALHPDYHPQPTTPYVDPLNPTGSLDRTPSVPTSDITESSTARSTSDLGFGKMLNGLGFGFPYPAASGRRTASPDADRLFEQHKDDVGVRTPLTSSTDDPDESGDVTLQREPSAATSRSWTDYDSQASVYSNDDVDPEGGIMSSFVDTQLSKSSNVLAPLPPFRDRQMIYVQMGDGRLVHRLSTIGEGDRSTRTGSDVSSVQTMTPLSEYDSPLPGGFPRPAR